MAVLTPLMRGSALTDCFTDECLLQGMLDFEAATALAQARCGVIRHLRSRQFRLHAELKILTFRRWGGMRRWRGIWLSHW